MRWNGLILAFGCLACRVAGAGSDPGDRLLGHWPLVTDAQDVSGGARHGRAVGVDFGPLGARFDGRASRIDVADDPALDLGAGEFTLSLRLSTESDIDDALGDLIGKYDPRSRRGFQLSILNHAGVTGSQANYRNLHFGIDDSRQDAEWRDEGRPGRAVFIHCLAVHDGALYAGTVEGWTNNDPGHVYRYAGTGRWEDLGSPWKSNGVTAMASYNGHLYVGVSRVLLHYSGLAPTTAHHIGGKVFRYEDGQWVDLGQLLGVDGINGMAVFRGKLYVTGFYQPAMFRYDGHEWTSLGSPEGMRPEALCVYNGALYATGYDEGAVYRFDGERWGRAGRLGDATQVYGLAIHEGQLYAGTWPNGTVYRLERGDEWVSTGRLGTAEEVMGPNVYNGKLYAGTLPMAEVFRFDGDDHWNTVGRVDFTPDVMYRRAWSLAVYDGRLFCGTLPSGHVRSFEAGKNVTWDHPLPAGWRHIAAVRDRKRLQLYVDGRLVSQSAEFAADDFSLSNDAPLRIGSGAHDHLLGRLRDVRIYGQALTAEEVQRLAAEEVSAAPPLRPIELTPLEEQAIGYATFQSHNQKVVSNRHGILLTYVQSASQDYMSQKWRLAHSGDGGKNFRTVFEETRATSSPVLETDREGGLYLTRPDFADGHAYLSRFPSPGSEPVTTTLPGGAAGKYCQILDEARKRIYYLGHNGKFCVTGTDGTVQRTIPLLVAGPKGVTQYPHLALDESGTLYVAWTTNDLTAYLYRSIQAMKTTDGGQSWVTLDGQPLTPPIVSDETGPTTRISRDDELEVHSWLSAFRHKQAKLHFVYWAKTTPERQRYLRYDAATGQKELDLEPIFPRDPPRQPNDSGVLITDPRAASAPLYFVSTRDDRRRLACLASQDNGRTWQEFATSEREFPHRVYAIGGARDLTRTGDIIGTFTSVAPTAELYTEPNSGAAYFFRIATRPDPPATTNYRIETIAGNGETGDTPDGAPDARATPVDLPFGVEYGPDGGLYITAVGSHRVLRLDQATGRLTHVAGSGRKGYGGDGGPAKEALLNEPYEARFDSRGNLLILDMRNHALRRVDRDTGIIRTIAGDGTLGDRGDGGPAQAARLHYPHSLALDAQDNIFIGDILNHRVRRIDAGNGRIETVVGNGQEGTPRDGGLAREQPLTTPQGLAIYDGGLWLASYRLHRIWRVDLVSGVIRHMAGTGAQGHSGDGEVPLRATLDGPRGMKISDDGVLYLLEGENNILRAYDIGRNSISTIAGVGPDRSRYEGDGGPARQAPLWQPHGVCVGPDGSLILSDTLNHRVRRLIPD